MAAPYDVDDPLLHTDSLKVTHRYNASPQGYDFVFVSTDEFGTPGLLNRYVFRELNIEFPGKGGYTDAMESLENPANLLREELREYGFFKFSPLRSNSEIVFVVTVSDGKTYSNLERNLENAFRNLVKELSRKRIWLPLMGTGSGGLTYIESIEATYEAIKAVASNFSGAEIVISLPEDFDDADFQHLYLVFSQDSIKDSKFSDKSGLQADRSIARRNQDSLNRAIIADVLAKNIAEIWPDHRNNNWPFMVHISGRWGSGKSSVLNFLKENLESNSLYNVEFEGDSKRYPWIVADYNAWLEQQNEKTWWALLNSVINAINTNTLYLSSWVWRTWRRWKHWIISGMILYVLIGLVAVGLVSSGKSADLSDLLTKILGFLTTLGALFAIFNKFSPSAQKTSQAIIELDSKPLAPLTKRFHKIISRSKNPIAIFIDDLDRCDADYVVGVLQSVQTAYANTPVLYVVAADRDWIVSAYEQKYSSFKEALAKPGQPLGYLFLKKIFQMSINIPELSSNQKGNFLNELLLNKGEMNDNVNSFREKEDREALRRNLTRMDIAEELKRQGVEVSTKVEKELKELPHRLSIYTDIMEPNPRAVKRLINAYGFRYLYSLQGNLNIDPDDLVVWSILDQRFPFVAQKVLLDPDLLNQLGDNGKQDKALSDPEISKILSKLDKEAVLQIRQIS